MIDTPRPASGPALAFAASLVLLFVLMRFPGSPDLWSLSHVVRWPLELPLVVLALAMIPRGRSGVARASLVAALATLLLLRLADLGSRLAFGRAFSPLTEMHLIGQGWTLASRTVGLGEAALAVSLSLLALVMVAVFLHRGLGRIDSFGSAARRRLAVLSAVLLAVGSSLWTVQQWRGVDLRTSADLGVELVERIAATRRAVADQKAFAVELADDPLADSPPRFAALAGLDVVVLFVESYGRSFVDAEHFETRAQGVLETLADDTARGGFSARSGWLDSPIRGGRSWLAHATLASGLALSDQARFDRLLGSGRPSLQSLLGDAGWRTAVVLPVVSGEWVEGAWYDVDRFLDGPALGYAGQGFGYVSMPDQYTLSAFGPPLREEGDDAPLAVTVGLLGSHAPWTPLALPVDWDTIGDGAVFDGSRREGKPLDWARPEPVRDAYARSLELTLGRVGEYLSRHGDEAIFVVLGDHQPAHVIAGWAPNAHVPIHVFARDPALLARLPDDVFVDGTVPGERTPALPMHAFRALFATAFEAPLAGDESIAASPGATLAPVSAAAPLVLKP